MRRFVYALLYVGLVFLGLAFTALNQETVTLDFHLGRLELPLAALVIGVIFLSVVVCLMICSGSKFKARIEIRKLTKKIVTLEREIERLRKLTAKAQH